ncbi:ATP-dependent DNA helicase DinG [Rummeliibacillus pycnus]|uniref:ATP-dependent DNA helicase DinG n=1 Tax=Rummeliibacillus pycnus TaxID=101070 RepID=UPI000C9CA859|nr:ATP-dependent DNA helicase DinG [Rummeliibacillus pycnus]
MESQTYAIVDLETTGHSSQQGDRIIQIAIVLMKDWKVISKYTSFVNPGKKIPYFIQDLTHITDQEVQDALPFEEQAQQIYELLQDTVFVAHNTDFDLPFLQAEFKRAGLPKWFGKHMDTVELSKILFPTAFSFKLQDISMELGIRLAHAHRADDDALATAYLLKACWEELLSLPLVTIEQLHERSFHLKSDLSQLFLDAIHIKRKQPNDSDGHLYYRDIALKQSIRVEKTDHKNLAYPSSFQEKEKLFEAAFNNFEVRPDQFKMMDTVWQALVTKQEIMTEASTGIGKTLAYLIPAIIFAKKNHCSVGISTYTSHLLDQLLQEELPKAEAILKTNVTTAVVKGMEHYVDLDRICDLLLVKDDSYDENFTKMQLIVWLQGTDTGDLSEITLSGGGQYLVDKIRRTQTTSVTHHKNAFDFYLKALSKCKDADLVITNHAMVLADLGREEPILKHLNGWILDEGHQFLQAATLRDEKIFSYTHWKYLFGQIGSTETHTIEHSFYLSMQQEDKIPLRQLMALESQFRDMTQSFDKEIDRLLHHLPIQNGKHRQNKQSFLLSNIELAQPFGSEFSRKLTHWLNLAESITTTYLQYPDELSLKQQTNLADWQYQLRELKICLAEWNSIFLRHQEKDTEWLEIDMRSMPGSLHIFKRPVQVEDSITDVLQEFRNKTGIIWTSGTLTVPNDRRFIAKQLGLSEDVPLYQFQAPKSYYDGASLYIVDDMPDIKKVTQTAYIESVADAIVQTVLATEGRCFVLFTAQDMLRKTVELIQETGTLDDYMLFAQGVSSGSRMRLLKMFQRFEHSVLFGTNSFWEGVDVPGDALAAVIVVRLPFSSPEEPFFKARAERITKQGLNSFYKLSLPEAILRFKQGFGRLIRSSQDKGVFIVLDRRIETKSYGQEFIDALPDIPVKKVSLEHMVFELEDWYNKH